MIATRNSTDIYFDCLGKKRYTARIRSKLGKVELAAIDTALELGHLPKIYLDSRTESFLDCGKCGMMGSISSDEGTSGPILEVQCGTQKVSNRDPERAWEQASDPYIYAVEARLFDEDVSNE